MAVLKPYALVAMTDEGTATFQFCETEAAREHATVMAVFGVPTFDARIKHGDEVDATLATLREDRRLTFEGDPPVYWFDVHYVPDQTSPIG